MVRERTGKRILRMRSSNYTLYGDMSGRVMRILADITPDFELYSIDEAFLGLGGFETRLAGHGRALRQRVLQWTGFPVSVGIAANKTLAKMGNHRASRFGRETLRYAAAGAARGSTTQRGSLSSRYDELG